MTCLLKCQDLHLPFYIIKNGKKFYGYIDRNGKIKIQPLYSSAEDFSEGLAAVKINGKWGYINKQGKIIIEPQFERANEFCEGMAAVKINGRYGFIDKTGNVVISPKYKFIPFGKFSGGFAIVNEAMKGKDNFIDTKGNYICKDNFDHILPFSEGLANIKLDEGAHCFIDRKGQIKFCPDIGGRGNFSDGIAKIVLPQLGGQSIVTYYNKSGKVIWESPKINKK